MDTCNRQYSYFQMDQNRLKLSLNEHFLELKQIEKILYRNALLKKLHNHYRSSRKLALLFECSVSSCPRNARPCCNKNRTQSIVAPNRIQSIVNSYLIRNMLKNVVICCFDLKELHICPKLGYVHYLVF